MGLKFVGSLDRRFKLWWSGNEGNDRWCRNIS